MAKTKTIKFSFKRPSKQIVARSIISAVLFAMLLILVIFPDVSGKSFLDGLLLFSYSVLPTLFPFLFITKMLTDLGMIEKITKAINKPFKLLFGTNGIAFYVFIMSIICGYPIGAKILSDLVFEFKHKALSCFSSYALGLGESLAVARSYQQSKPLGSYVGEYSRSCLGTHTRHGYEQLKAVQLL